MDTIKTIVALGKKEEYDAIKRNSRYEVLNNDILYREGILEFLESQSDVELIITSKNLPGEIEFEELKKQIKKINKEIQIEFIKPGEILSLELEKEEIINLVKKTKTIGVAGTGGIGKTIFSTLIAEWNKNKKVLIVSTDNNKNINEILEKEKTRYDLIIIDGLEKVKNVSKINFKLIDEILIISGANLVEIKKSIRIITLLNSVFKSKPIKIVFNKVSEHCIEHEILNGAFKKENIIGKINYNTIFDEVANSKDYTKLLKNEEIKGILCKI